MPASLRSTTAAQQNLDIAPLTNERLRARLEWEIHRTGCLECRTSPCPEWRPVAVLLGKAEPLEVPVLHASIRPARPLLRLVS